MIITFDIFYSIFYIFLLELRNRYILNTYNQVPKIRSTKTQPAQIPVHYILKYQLQN